MPRLIDADELKGYLMQSTAYAWVLHAIDNAPTIDAVPVVRCKDCKWWDECDELDENGYCHHGERKDDED